MPALSTSASSTHPHYMCLDWSAHLFRDSPDKSKILPSLCSGIGSNHLSFFRTSPEGFFAYGLILFSFTTSLFLISRMEEAELLKERFQAITVSAYSYNLLYIYIYLKNAYYCVNELLCDLWIIIYPRTEKERDLCLLEIVTFNSDS